LIENIVDTLDFKLTQEGKAFKVALIVYFGTWLWWGYIKLIIADIDNLFKVNAYAVGSALGAYLILKLWNRKK